MQLCTCGFKSVCSELSAPLSSLSRLEHVVYLPAIFEAHFKQNMTSSYIPDKSEQQKYAITERKVLKKERRFAQYDLRTS